MYEIRFDRARARKFIRKATPDLQAYLRGQIEPLKTNPYLGEKLSGDLKDYRSLHLSRVSVEYRVIYYINEAEKYIGIVYTGTRENAYDNIR